MTQSFVSGGIARPTGSTLVAIMLLVVPTSMATQPQEPESDLKEMVAAWKAREARTHSGEFEWKELRVMSVSASQQALGPFGPAPGAEPKGAITDWKTLRHEYHRGILFKGENIRNWDDEPGRFADGRWFHRKFTSASDGRQFRTLREGDLPGYPRYQGNIQPTEAESVHSLAAVVPILFHYRPFRYSAEFVARFKDAKQDGLIDATPCRIVQQVVDPQGPVLESLWLDPRQGFCVRRHIRKVGEVIVQQTDISYATDPKHGPVPRSWKDVRHYENGEFDRSIETTVTTSKLNHEVADERFIVEFPVDTLVSERTHPGQRYPSRYIIGPNNTKKDASHGNMKKGAPDHAGRAGWFWRRALGLSVTSFVVLLAAFGVYRMYRLHKA